MSWQDKLDLLRSIKEIQSDERKGKDFCIDPLRFNDLSEKRVKDKLISTIKEALGKSYSVGRLIKIDVPKANYILRPAARPNLFDWIIYNAVVNIIAGQIYKKVPRNTFSFNRFRDKESGKRRESTIDYWLEFDDKALAYVKNKKYSHLLVTDITSFYEHISHEVLKNRLLCFSNDRDYVSAVNYLINNILLKWSEEEKVQGFGLPQGPTASTILADIYLYSLDKELNKKGIRFIRYMDDFRLFAKNIVHMKHAIKILVISLRGIKLNLNAKKTVIYETNDREIYINVFDPEKGRLKLIDTAFRSKKRDQILLVAPSLFELKNKINMAQFGERYLKFYLGRLIDMMKYELLDETDLFGILIEFMGVFENKHHLSSVLSWFFVACACYNNKSLKAIQTGMIDFVCNKDKNIYEWQEMWALDTIRQLGKVSISNLKRIKAKYSSNNELCYMQYALMAGETSDVDEREELLAGRRVDGDQYRATLLAVQEMNRHVVSRAHLSVPFYFQEYLSIIKTPIYGFKYMLTKQKLDQAKEKEITKAVYPVDEFNTGYDGEPDYMPTEEPDFNIYGY